MPACSVFNGNGHDTLPTVYIVDDSKTSLTCAEGKLARLSISCWAMSSGRALIAQIERDGVPDLIISDWKMVHPGGPGILHRYGKKTKIIIITAEGDHVPLISRSAVRELSRATLITELSEEERRISSQAKDAWAFLPKRLLDVYLRPLVTEALALE